jgi:hypothetical protein
MAGVQVKLTMGRPTVSSHGFTGNDPVTFQQDSVRREATLIEPIPGTTLLPARARRGRAQDGGVQTRVQTSFERPRIFT